jgi:hypothetical protein
VFGGGGDRDATGTFQLGLQLINLALLTDCQVSKDLHSISQTRLKKIWNEGKLNIVEKTSFVTKKERQVERKMKSAINCVCKNFMDR